MKSRNDNRIRWCITACFLAVSCLILIVSRRIAVSNINGNALFELVSSLTEGNKIRQIIAAEVLFIAGRLITETILHKESSSVKVVWAFPVAVIAWTAESLFLLLTGIPFSSVTMALLFIVILICIVARGWKNIIQSDKQEFVRECLIFLSLSIIFSAGVLPTFMSSDSYYYVMQYGEILAKVHALTFDTAGAFMTWTGITPALLSSLAAFCGFETIITFFYHLVCSMLLCFGISLYDSASGVTADKKRSVFMAALATGCLIIVPSFELLASWIISNTYCMVFSFFLMQGLYMYAMGENRSPEILIMLSAIVTCLTLSRAELCVTMAVIIFIATYLKFSKKEMLVLSVPMAAAQILFLLRLDIQMSHSRKAVYDNMLTPQVQTIMVVAVLGAVIYCVFMDKQPFRFLHDRMKWMIFAVLPASCIGICAVNPDKWLTSIRATWYNLATQFWGLFPLFVLILAVLILIIVRRMNFHLMYAFGYLFAGFLICLARKQPLRDGFGDSCNRVFMSAIPIILYALFVTLMTFQNPENPGIEKR